MYKLCNLFYFIHPSVIPDVCFCFLAFAGFLRYDELSRLRWSDVSFFLRTFAKAKLINWVRGVP